MFKVVEMRAASISAQDELTREGTHVVHKISLQEVGVWDNQDCHEGRPSDPVVVDDAVDPWDANRHFHGQLGVEFNLPASYSAQNKLGVP